MIHEKIKNKQNLSKNLKLPKRQYQEQALYWKKVFTKDISDKGLLSKLYYKEHLKLNTKKNSNKMDQKP